MSTMDQVVLSGLKVFDTTTVLALLVSFYVNQGIKVILMKNKEN